MTPDRTAEQIARYRNMVQGDPEDDLAHFRLGQVLMDDGQYAEAVKAVRADPRTEPRASRGSSSFSATASIKAGQKDKAVEVLTKGWTTADERGDRLPMEAMGKLLTSARVRHPRTGRAKGRGRWLPGTGFKCQRPGCMEGKRPANSRPRPFPTRSASASTPISARGCWTLWYKDLSIKVINELRLDLSSDFGQAEYDKHMRDFMGFEQ